MTISPFFKPWNMSQDQDVCCDKSDAALNPGQSLRQRKDMVHPVRYKPTELHWGRVLSSYDYKHES